MKVFFDRLITKVNDKILTRPAYIYNFVSFVIKNSFYIVIYKQTKLFFKKIILVR